MTTRNVPSVSLLTWSYLKVHHNPAEDRRLRSQRWLLQTSYVWLTRFNFYARCNSTQLLFLQSLYSLINTGTLHNAWWTGLEPSSGLNQVYNVSGWIDATSIPFSYIVQRWRPTCSDVLGLVFLLPPLLDMCCMKSAYRLSSSVALFISTVKLCCFFHLASFCFRSSWRARLGVDAENNRNEKYISVTTQLYEPKFARFFNFLQISQVNIKMQK